MAERQRRDDEARDTKRERDESGQPGGGAGRRDEVGRTGVWPMSGPLPEGDAPLVGEHEFGQGSRGAAGYEDSGGSEIHIEPESIEPDEIEPDDIEPDDIEGTDAEEDDADGSVGA